MMKGTRIFARLMNASAKCAIECRPQEIASNPAGSYQLFRVGDAVAARNIHAAIYDSLRLCSVF